MRVKLDEDLSPRSGLPLQRAGHQVLSVRGQGWGGLKDSELWPRVLAERVFWITGDKGFGDLRHYPPGSHEGILLLRPDLERPSAFAALIDNVLRSHKLEELRGCLIVATPRSIRVRRPPAPQGS